MKFSTFTRKLVTTFAATGLALGTSLFIAGCGGGADAPTEPAAGDTAADAAADDGSSTKPAGGSGTN